jgi:hypothetical protein
MDGRLDTLPSNRIYFGFKKTLFDSSYSFLSAPSSLPSMFG